MLRRSSEMQNNDAEQAELISLNRPKLFEGIIRNYETQGENYARDLVTPR